MVRIPTPWGARVVAEKWRKAWKVTRCMPSRSRCVRRPAGRAGPAERPMTRPAGREGLRPAPATRRKHPVRPGITQLILPSCRLQKGRVGWRLWSTLTTAADWQNEGAPAATEQTPEFAVLLPRRLASGCALQSPAVCSWRPPTTPSTPLVRAAGTFGVSNSPAPSLGDVGWAFLGPGLQIAVAALIVAALRGRRPSWIGRLRAVTWWLLALDLVLVFVVLTAVGVSTI
jgi:hypothetical protein